MNTKIKDVDGFDYSKYESKPTWESPCLREREYWGMHERDGRLLLDVERYKFACEDIGITDFIPEPLKKTKEKFFIPAKKEKYDYMINIFNGLLDNFANDWNSEYKPIFDMIEKPCSYSGITVFLHNNFLTLPKLFSQFCSHKILRFPLTWQLLSAFAGYFPEDHIFL